MKRVIRNRAWVILAAVGVLFIVWGLHMIFIIPTYDGSHWNWMNPTVEMMEYYRFLFRILGVWASATGILIATTASTGLRQGSRWAWYALAYTPVQIALLGVMFFWLFMFTIPLFALTIIALWLSCQEFFLKSEILRAEGIGG